MEIIASIKMDILSEDISVRYNDLSTDSGFVKIKNIDLKSFGNDNLERVLNCRDASVEFVCDCPILFNMTLNQRVVSIKVI